MGLKDLFDGMRQAVAATTPSQSNIPVQQNPNNRQEGETYHHWGLRMCAIADGSSYTLAPYLHNVYNYIYNEQVNNKELQDQKRKDIECKIEQKQNEIDGYNNELSGIGNQRDNIDARIKELKEERTRIKNEKYETNKEARLKLIIGLVILIPLTLYLFLFYSSTFFSAFFKDFTSDADVLNSMFDAQALSKAYEAGVTELGFVLFAPIIFLALGFVLHFFTKQKGFGKYIKMTSILCITFVFDAILAYLIGKHLHEMAVIIGTEPLNSTYGIHDAVEDINTWAVIFCGFIVYIIWGLVFDMIMSAHEQLDLNKIKIRGIDAEIENKNTERNNIDSKEKDLNDSIVKANNEKTYLISQLNGKVMIDNAAIKQEMNNFYSGWMAQMSVLGKQEEDKKDVKETFETTMKTLFN